MLVFLSYVREDSETVLWLKKEFEQQHIDCFIDTDAIQPGELWEAKIRSEIDRCDFFLACFSEHYSSKRETYMNREIEIALDGRRRIFPVLLSGGMPVLPDALDSALRMLNWTPLRWDSWHINFGKLLTSMMPGSNVRGAGLALLARRFPTAGAQEKIEILEKVRQMVDLPEVIPLVEQGLFDRSQEVRFHAASLLISMGEAGAGLTARVLLENQNADDSMLVPMISVLTMNTKSPLVVPALIEVMRHRLSRLFDGYVDINGMNGSNTGTAIMMAIMALGQIGEPADVIREYLMSIQTDAPQTAKNSPVWQAIEQTLRDALAKL